jgi:hypothetical protein
MASSDDWLRLMAAAGKGGARFPQLEIDRGLPWVKVLAFGADYSGDTFRAALRLEPDAPDSPLVELNVAVGSHALGVTPVTVSLTKAQTANPAIIPPDSVFAGVIELAFDLLHAPAGGTEYRILAGIIPVSGKVTNAS